jgi:hypothetical protein
MRLSIVAPLLVSYQILRWYSIGRLNRWIPPNLESSAFALRPSVNIGYVYKSLPSNILPLHPDKCVLANDALDCLVAYGDCKHYNMTRFCFNHPAFYYRWS